MINQLLWYFIWYLPKKNTQKDTFKGEKKNTQQDFMYVKDRFNYFENTDFQMIELRRPVYLPQPR